MDVQGYRNDNSIFGADSAAVCVSFSAPVYETVFSTDSAGPQTGRISEKQFDVVDFYSSFTVFACSIVYTRYYTGTKI